MRRLILCAVSCCCAIVAGVRAGDAPKNDKLTWAWQTPVRPALPRVKNHAWITNPIDVFIAAALEKEGLSPSPPADRLTLLRRVTFDLSGLPPTPAETDAFLSDSTPDAYEKLV